MRLSPETKLFRLKRWIEACKKEETFDDYEFFILLHQLGKKTEELIDAGAKEAIKIGRLNARIRNFTLVKLRRHSIESGLTTGRILEKALTDFFKNKEGKK